MWKQKYPSPELLEKIEISPKQMWAINRFWMETENLKSKRYGGKGHHHWYILLAMLKSFEFASKLFGFYSLGKRNAYDIKLKEIDFYFDNLPKSFDGFKILHLSDLHLDGMQNLPQTIIDLLKDVDVNLCVLTGDYRTKLHGPTQNVMENLRRIISTIKSEHGFLGILGNHDDCHMISPLEEMGIKMLVNEVIELHKGDDILQFIGIDDVHYYYTDQALHAMEYAKEAFSIAMIHSPELFKFAAQSKTDLYLCGHTHAGQICLPGGYPVISHLNRGKKFYYGQWQYENMTGYTSSGVGTSGIPIRFNTRGECVVFTLHRKEKP